MDWKAEAKKELQNYERLKMSLPNIRERIRGLEDKMTALKSSSSGDTPVQGGGSKFEDMLLNCIVEKERLILTYKANKTRVKLIERGLDSLTETEKIILTEFSRNKSGAAVDIISEKTNYERTHIYRLYDKALYKFTVAEYGITEF